MLILLEGVAENLFTEDVCQRLSVLVIDYYCLRSAC